MEEIAEDSVLYCDPYKPEDIADKITTWTDLSLLLLKADIKKYYLNIHGRRQHNFC